MDYAVVGSRIRIARKSKRWTQGELAERVGVSLSFLGHVERGTRKASVETFVKLADALGVSLDALFGRECADNWGEASLVEKARELLALAWRLSDTGSAAYIHTKTTQL